MSVAVVWLDLEQAKLFHFTHDRMQREIVQVRRVDHHTHRKEGDERDSVVMYDEVAKRLEGARRILVLGPGIARLHFVDRLNEKFKAIASSIIGCEASDHPTDAQIAAHARKALGIK